MAITILDGGTLRTITKAYVKQAGVLRAIRTIKVQDGGTLRTVATFADPLSVFVTDTGKVASSSTMTTDPATASPSGGFAPYTYAWTLVTNGGGAASTANTPTLASTTFTKTGLSPGSDITDVWRCTVTDALGNTASDVGNANFIYPTGA